VLAYVFWHRPSTGVEPAAYEEKLGRFHAALAETPPPGFRHSLAFRIAGAPWLTGDGYEDWYVLDDSQALDALDRAAVSSAAGVRHDAVAALAADGAGGLYRLRAGQEALDGAASAAWLRKRSGVSYDEFYARLAPWTNGAGAGLWGRQMVLGPTPEFCLRAPGSLDLPAELEPLAVRTTQVWP
jgi:hypothetical protein